MGREREPIAEVSGSRLESKRTCETAVGVDGMVILFSAATALLIYTYIGYPLAMGLLGRILPPRRHPVDPDLRPTVTVLIAAFNEERHIGARLQNLEGLRYPKEKLQVLVG